MEKLVRDKIISKIISEWRDPDFREVFWDEKLDFLLKKLVEESKELQADKNKEELADVEEVILAIYNHFWWTKSEIEKERLKKLEKNWWFEKWYILTL